MLESNLIFDVTEDPPFAFEPAAVSIERLAPVAADVVDIALPSLGTPFEDVYANADLFQAESAPDEPGAMFFALASDDAFDFPPMEPMSILTLDAQLAMFGAPVMTLDGYDNAWPEGVFALPPADALPHFMADGAHFIFEAFDAPVHSGVSNAYLLF